MIGRHYTGKLPTYPSPKQTLTLTPHLRQNDGLGEGKVSSSPEPKLVRKVLTVEAKE